MTKGKILKLLRLKRSIKQQDFAKKTGITANYLSLIENDKRNPPINYFKKAADVLGVSVNLFLWEEVDFKRFKDKESKKLAKKINNNLSDIYQLLFRELINN